MRTEVTRRELLAAVGAAAAASALPRSALAQEQGGEWPAFGYDAAKTGYNPDGEGPTDAVGGAWQFTGSADSVGAAPAVADGTVYVASTDGSLTALDAASGEAVEGWPVELDDGTVSPPTVVDGTVYLGDDGGRLYALDAASGEIQWRFGTDGAIKGSPTVVDGTVYVGSGDGFVYAVDAEGGGETEWEFDAGGGITGGVALEQSGDGEATVYAANTGGGVFTIDAATGDPRWEEPYVAEGSINSAPVVGDGVVYVGVGEGNEGSIRAIDAESGEETWEFETDGVVFGSPAVAGGQVYAASRDRHVYAIDAESGTENWGFDTGRQLNNSPVVVGETVYAVSFDNTVYGLTTDGDERFAAGTGGAVTVSPAVAGGRVYVGSDNGAVYALESGGTAEFAEVGGDGSNGGVEDSPLSDPDTDGFTFLALPAMIAAVLAALGGGVYAVYRSDLPDRFSVDEAPVEALYEDEEGIPDYDERTETEAWALIVEDVMARADERTKTAAENVIVTKHVDSALESPITAYEVESARDERVRVTITEPLEGDREALEEQPLNEGWSLGRDALTFETVLEPDERVRTMVGRSDAVDRAEALVDKPTFTIESVDQPDEK